MRTFTDEEMGRLLATTKPYSVVILKQGPRFGDETTPGTVWEHGRRNFGLRDDGVLAVVLPVTDGPKSAASGCSRRRSTTPPRSWPMTPAWPPGVFTFEVHPCRGFPGDALP